MIRKNQEKNPSDPVFLSIVQGELQDMKKKKTWIKKKKKTALILK